MASRGVAQTTAPSNTIARKTRHEIGVARERPPVVKSPNRGTRVPLRRLRQRATPHIMMVVGTLRTFTMSAALVALTACGNGDITNASDAASDGAKVDSAKARDAGVPVNHRSTSASCPTERGPGPSMQPYPQGQASGCASDSDCTAGENGRCFPFEGLVGPGGCSYDKCFTDSDCGPTTPCVCRTSATDNTANVCDPGGNCVVDSDCGPDGYCSPSVSSCSYSSPAPYFCHTKGDACINDTDCPSVDAGATSCSTFSSCAYDPQVRYWGCTQLTCCLP